MVEHIIFGWIVLMMLGYVFIEWARYRRGREKHGDPLEYPGARLVLRSAVAVVLLVFLGIVVYMKPFYGGPPIAGTYALSAVAVLFVLLVADFLTVYRQYRKARTLREQRFINEVSSLVASHDSTTRASEGPESSDP